MKLSPAAQAMSGYRETPDNVTFDRVLRLIEATRERGEPRLHLTLHTVNLLDSKMDSPGRWKYMFGYRVVLSDSDEGLVYE